MCAPPKLYLNSLKLGPWEAIRIMGEVMGVVAPGWHECLHREEKRPKTAHLLCHIVRCPLPYQDTVRRPSTGFKHMPCSLAFQPSDHWFFIHDSVIGVCYRSESKALRDEGKMTIRPGCSGTVSSFSAPSPTLHLRSPFIISYCLCVKQSWSPTGDPSPFYWAKGNIYI